MNEYEPADEVEIADAIIIMLCTGFLIFTALVLLDIL